MRAWGYSYEDIAQMKQERDRYRFALNTIVVGSFGKEPPRSIREAKRVALRALVVRPARKVIG